MGLFDTIVNNGFKLKLPREVTSFLKANGADIPDEFQTKDLENCLSTFKLFPNGRLLELTRKPTGRKVKYNSPFANWEDNRPLLEKIYHNIFIKSKYKDGNLLVDETIDVYEKSNLTADFEMYAYELIGGRYLALNFDVQAVKGIVKKAKLTRWELESEEDAASRTKQDNEWKEKMDKSFAKQKELRARWYYPLIKEIYNPLIFFTGLLIRNICTWLTNKTYKWKRF